MTLYVPAVFHDSVPILSFITKFRQADTQPPLLTRLTISFSLFISPLSRVIKPFGICHHVYADDLRCGQSRSD